MSKRYTTYREFFPFYLEEHSLPETRAMHYFGTACGISLFVAGVVTGNGWLILLAFIMGYALAFLAHRLYEHNRPATFTHPLWSFRADFHMFWLWITGQLPETLARHNVTPRKSRHDAKTDGA